MAPSLSEIPTAAGCRLGVRWLPAGYAVRDQAPRAHPSIDIGAMLILRPEPPNRFDKNATQIANPRTGGVIGYVPAPIASEFAATAPVAQGGSGLSLGFGRSDAWLAWAWSVPWVVTSASRRTSQPPPWPSGGEHQLTISLCTSIVPLLSVFSPKQVEVQWNNAVKVGFSLQP